MQRSNDRLHVASRTAFEHLQVEDIESESEDEAVQALTPSPSAPSTLDDKPKPV